MTLTGVFAAAQASEAMRTNKDMMNLIGIARKNSPAEMNPLSEFSYKSVLQKFFIGALPLVADPLGNASQINRACRF